MVDSSLFVVFLFIIAWQGGVVKRGVSKKGAGDARAFFVYLLFVD